MNGCVVEDRPTDARLLILAAGDNIGVLIATLNAGENIMICGQMVTLSETLGLGHKLALTPIAAGEEIHKYGFPIGVAASDIALGAHVHIHNLKSRYTAVAPRE